MKIAICQKQSQYHHSTDWTFPWVEYCKNNKLIHEVVDLYQPNAIVRLRKFDCLLWHFSNYVFADMLEARSILYSAKAMGLKIFPDFNDAWHFDDKVAETYLLQTINAPIPGSYIFYDHEAFMKWLNGGVEFPLIGKLRCGSGSHNVKLLKNKGELRSYAKRMFGKGYKPAPSLLFKATSNIKSSNDWATIKKRARRIPEFLRTLASAKHLPDEKGYVFLQEFIQNEGYDLKIVVVGDKLSFIARNIRKGDFRASGGGDLFFDKSLINQDIIESAFAVSDKLGFQCMGYDYVVDKASGIGKIVEISYGFSHAALLQANGFFDRCGVWHEEPLNAPDEIIRNILKLASKK